MEKSRKIPSPLDPSARSPFKRIVLKVALNAFIAHLNKHRALHTRLRFVS